MTGVSTVHGQRMSRDTPQLCHNFSDATCATTGPTKQVVFAILLGKGKQLTLSTLFPSPRPASPTPPKTLHTYRSIEVEAIGIPTA